MMKMVNIHEAKTHLSRLVEAAAKGDVFVIAKAGKPMVKVLPLEAHEDPITDRIGFMRGEVAVPDDFDAMGGALIEALFEGNRS